MNGKDINELTQAYIKMLYRARQYQYAGAIIPNDLQDGINQVHSFAMANFNPQELAYLNNQVDQGLASMTSQENMKNVVRARIARDYGMQKGLKSLDILGDGTKLDVDEFRELNRSVKRHRRSNEPTSYRTYVPADHWESELKPKFEKLAKDVGMTVKQYFEELDEIAELQGREYEPDAQFKAAERATKLGLAPENIDHWKANRAGVEAAQRRSTGIKDGYYDEKYVDSQTERRVALMDSVLAKGEMPYNEGYRKEDLENEHMRGDVTRAFAKHEAEEDKEYVDNFFDELEESGEDGVPYVKESIREMAAMGTPSKDEDE